jgi:hypothetical protein
MLDYDLDMRMDEVKMTQHLSSRVCFEIDMPLLRAFTEVNSQFTVDSTGRLMTGIA